MQQSEFEQQVQQKMQALNIVPAAGVWQKIEIQLPRKRRRKYVLLLLLPLLLMGSFIIYYFAVLQGNDQRHLNNINKNFTTNQEKEKAENAERKNSVAFSRINKRRDTVADAGNKSIMESISFLINQKKIAPPGSDKKNQSDQQIQKTKANAHTAQSSMTIQPAPAISEPTIGVLNLKEVRLSNDYNTFSDSTQKFKELAETISGNEFPVVENGQTNKLLTHLVRDKANKKAKDIKAEKDWDLFAVVTTGVSNITNAPFGHSNIYLSNSSLGQAYTTPGAISSYPASPKRALAFSFGLEAQKQIGSKTILGLGFRFSRCAAKTMVGKKVDTVASIVYANKSITPGEVFSVGNAMNYPGKVDLVEIPLTFQYQPMHKIPVSIEAGIVPGYLISADVLQFDNSRGVYFTSRSSNNHLSLSGQAGLNVKVGKQSRFPFSIGYRYYYQASSIVKKDFGEQHMMSSGIVLKFHL